MVAAMNDRAFITPQFGLQLQELVRDRRATPQRPRPAMPHSAKRDGKIIVMLLEDLESGKRARAAWLTGQETIPKQMLTVYGYPVSNLMIPATFSVAWNGETVDEISVHATAVELKTRLEEFSFINPGDVGVFFGNHLRTIHDVVHEFDVFRWIVQIHNGADQFGLMKPTIDSNHRQTWMGCEATILEDTRDTIDVTSVVPVGTDIKNITPMQRGAIGTAFAHPETGWTVDAIEARNVTTDFVDHVIFPYG
jgi:hypothetical protein